VKPLLTIWETKARSVEQVLQRRVEGCVRERRRFGVGEEVVGEEERDGAVLLLLLVGEGGSLEVAGGDRDGSWMRCRRKGIRSEGRR
jgi:hypothetical protein